MRTLGIDLATVASKTAACVIEWPDASDSWPNIVSLQTTVTDDDIVAMAAEADGVAIDAPFGWPRPWAAAVAQHRPGRPFTAIGSPAILTRRATDAWIADQLKIYPLAVAANLIGATAIRCARLVHILGMPVDVGMPVKLPFVSEVYPAAALRRWGLSYQLYKGRQFTEARRLLIDALVGAGLPIRLSGESRRVLEASDDAFDALVASLVARAIGQSLTDDAPAHLQEAGAAEGWIRVPRQGVSLGALSRGWPGP